MTTYSRWSTAAAAAETEAHVRAHLSAVASPDDDPDQYAEQVVISRVDQRDGVLITGVLAHDPVADYLHPAFDPEADVAANPLSVPSILETT